MQDHLQKHLTKWGYFFMALVIFTMLIAVQPASASPLYHEAPPGSEWIMADWMFLSFGIFAGVSFLAFLVSLKRGLLSNLEDAKYYVLEVEEEDYYTPEWAREGDES
jgi:hypothetical protein